MNENLIEQVKILRLKVGAGMLDCKNALIASNYDMDLAILYLRKKGLIDASEKSVKLSKQGLVSAIVHPNMKSAVILEVNCETDFVARSIDFVSYVLAVAEYFLYREDLYENFYLVDEAVVVSDKFKNLHTDLISKCKENIFIRRVRRIKVSLGMCFVYNHGSEINYGNIASLLIVNNILGYESIVKDVAMQIVAMKPRYLSINTMPKDVIDKEKNLYLEKLIEQKVDKNKIVLDQIVNGQLNKFYKEVVLLEQNFVKDLKITVNSYISGKFDILNFVRFELGENI